MAIHRSVIGTFNQSMGDVTFTNWKGLKVAKQKVPAHNTSNTPGQQGQRNKFALLAMLAGHLGPLLRIGFRTSAVNKTEQNVFTSKNYGATSLDIDLVASIDFSQMVISAGNVEVLGSPKAIANGTGDLEIQWTDNSNGSTALPGDLVYAAAVNQSTLETTTFSGPVRRDDGVLSFLPAHFSPAGKGNFRVYVFVKRATTTATSPSQFMLVQ